MPEIDVSVEKMESMRMSGDATHDSHATFDVDVSMTEVDRNPGQMKLAFDIKLVAEPSLAKFSVSGMAHIKGKEEEMDSLVGTDASNSAPPVFMMIYQKVYAIMYLMCGS